MNTDHRSKRGLIRNHVFEGAYASLKREVIWSTRRVTSAPRFLTIRRFPSNSATLVFPWWVAETLSRILSPRGLEYEA